MRRFRVALGPLVLAVLASLATLMAAPDLRAEMPFRFASIDGGEIALDDWRGKPVLVVNTASRCGYTGQYDQLQALHERYADRGVLVLAVPSDDFRQELSSNKDVAEFCEVNFGLTLPMTTITHVKGAKAHPFYAWVKAQSGFAPRWNFNKVLIAPDGSVDATFASPVKPTSAKITGRIDAMLAGG